VAEPPGCFRDRVALERVLDRMGWCITESVADADVLAVVGVPDEVFAAVVEHVWAQMSEPRVRIQVQAGGEATTLLSEAREQLRARVRAAPPRAAGGEVLRDIEGRVLRDFG